MVDINKIFDATIKYIDKMTDEDWHDFILVHDNTPSGFAIEDEDIHYQIKFVNRTLNDVKFEALTDIELQDNEYVLTVVLPYLEELFSYKYCTVFSKIPFLFINDFFNIDFSAIETFLSKKHNLKVITDNDTFSIISKTPFSDDELSYLDSFRKAD